MSRVSWHHPSIYAHGLDLGHRMPGAAVRVQPPDGARTLARTGLQAETGCVQRPTPVRHDSGAVHKLHAGRKRRVSMDHLTRIRTRGQGNEARGVWSAPTLRSPAQRSRRGPASRRRTRAPSGQAATDSHLHVRRTHTPRHMNHK